MRMRRCLVSTVLAVIVLISCFGVFVSALAYPLDEEVVSALNSASNKACDYVGIEGFDIAVVVGTEDEMGDDKSYCVFNETEYNNLSNKQKRKYIKNVTDILNTNGDGADEYLNKAQKQQAYNFLVSVDDKVVNEAVASLLDDTGANILTAVGIFAPAMPYISTFFGILIILILLATTLVTIIDIVFITLPVFSMNSDKKPRFVSREAYKALQLHIEQGSNVYWEYFKRRFIAIIIIFIGVTLLATGRIGTIIADLISAINI